MTERDLAAAARTIGDGVGPVAIDAERASGYRYGQKAYLVQLRREGAGSWLIDPAACPDLSPVNAAIGSAEWILHAATQDLACLAEVGLRPQALFDTELAGRLLGLPRVGLAAVVEHYLGLSLAKEHSAVDWSTRPLPEPWLRYAALDVEVLIELRNLMGVDLASTGKDQWAREEFAALLTWEPAERVDPWRRTSGIHKLRSTRDIAAVRELWFERDRIARERDLSPGRVISDQHLMEIVMAHPRTLAEVNQSKPAARYARFWFAAVERARALPEAQLPPRSLSSDRPPHPKTWTEKKPEAAEHLALVRQQLAAFSEESSVPVENVCTPDTLRRIVWDPPRDTSTEGFAAALAAMGARPWQVEIVAEMLHTAFVTPTE
ncbi:MAG: HRDC domain-containing protein [Nostocoides sp.]